MTSIAVYNREGKEAGKVNLPKALFDVPLNNDLLHQAVRMYQANMRRSTAHTKDRSEVSGGGRKPWRQKGTGRARHGSRRSPLWRHGGVTFGPRRERNWKLDMPEKMRRKALFVALSSKLRDKELLVLDELIVKDGKTKELTGLLKNISRIQGFASAGEKGKKVLVVSPEKNALLGQATRNLSSVKSISAPNLNALEVLSRKYVVMPKESIVVLEKTFGIKSRKHANAA